MSKIVCFGEVLWDVFPNHKKIGGAPLNVATRLKSFDNDVAIISAVGKDDLGDKILDFINDKKINPSLVAILNDFSTGKVQIVLDKKGAASYTIEHPKAWDKIPFTQQSAAAVQQSDAFVFGSLAARDEVSKKTLYQLLDVAKFKVFDINLRPPFYEKKLLIDLMLKADFIKLNDEELYEVSAFLGSKFNNLEQNLQLISSLTNTKQICVTKGEHGGVLLYNNELFYNSGFKINVVDTVGSGDSFLATLIHFLLKDQNPQKAINTACAVGALVAQKSGANPTILESEIAAFMHLL